MKNDKAETLLNALKNAPVGQCIEIGCIRENHEVPEDGFSTVHLAQWAIDHDRFFMSIDTNEDNVKMGNQACLERGLPATTVVCGNGEEFLTAMLNPIAFLYLDSHRDPWFSWDQYKAATLMPGAIICVDDCHCYDGWAWGKGTHLVTYLEAKKIPYELVPTFGNQNYQNYMLVFSHAKGKKGGTT